MNQQDNLWKGLVSYTESDTAKNRYIFSGRRDAIMTLLAMVKNNLLVTLYGKSGIGKTSMLQAGLFPLLRRDNYLPVLLRPAEIDYDNFDAYVIETVKDQLKKHNVTRYIAGKDGRFNQKMDNGTDDSVGNIALWFASSKFYDSDNREVFPVLVFDQFEALFIGSRDKGSEVLRGLHTMIDDSELQCPEGVVCHNEANFRIMLVVREDDLFRLEDAIDELGYRSMKNNRLRLRALTDAQAREVIEKPVDELKRQTGFSLIPDDEREEVIKRIIDISRNRSGKVDSAILSLVCSELYSLANGGVITSRLVGQIDKNPLGRFYSNAIRGLKDEERLYIESLVDNRGRRRTVFRSNVNKYIKEPDKLFNGENKLLQNVPGTKPADGDPENQPVELVHDLLAQAVGRSRAKRKAKSRAISLKGIALTMSILLFMLSYLLVLNDYDENIADKKGGYVVADTSGDFSYYGRPDIDSIYVITDSVAPPDNFYFSVSDCSHIKKIVFETPTYRKCKARVVLSDCPSLTELVLPDSMISELTLLVTDCHNLSHIHIAKDVENLQAEINLKSDNHVCNALIIDKENKNYIYDQGILWDLRKRKPYLVTHQISEAYFPEEMQWYRELYGISNARFADNDSIKFSNGDRLILERYTKIGTKGAVDLSGLTITQWIGERAFANCKINAIQFPPNLKCITKAAFINCDNIRKVYIPDGVEWIGEYAFADCAKLTEVSVSANTYISGSAFEGSPDVVLSVRDGKGGEITFSRGEKCWPWKPMLDHKYFLYGTVEDSVYGKYGSYIAENEMFLLYDGKTKTVSYEDANNFMGTRAIIYNRSRSQFIFYQKGQKTIRFIPITGGNGEFDFIGERPFDLEEIYMPYASPFIYLAEGKIDRQYTRKINLEDSLKRNITLYVPSGCSRNFADIPEYQGFKAIKEMSKAELTKMKMLFYINLPQFITPNSTAKKIVTIVWLMIAAAMITMIWYPISYSIKRIRGEREVLFVYGEVIFGLLVAFTTFVAVYFALAISIDLEIYIATSSAVIATFGVLIIYYYLPLPRGERMPPWLKKLFRRKGRSDNAIID